MGTQNNCFTLIKKSNQLISWKAAPFPAVIIHIPSARKSKKDPSIAKLNTQQRLNITLNVPWLAEKAGRLWMTSILRFVFRDGAEEVSEICLLALSIRKGSFSAVGNDYR